MLCIHHGNILCYSILNQINFKFKLLPGVSIYVSSCTAKVRIGLEARQIREVSF